MSIDLDDIERRINDGIYGDDRMTDTGRDDAFSALAALLNEVEQLRTEASYLRACVPPTRPTDYGHEAWAETVRDAVDAERAAVVAWLRRGDECCVANADRIERGEHHSEEEK